MTKVFIVAKHTFDIRTPGRIMRNPPFSPDLAPSDYHFLRSLSNDMRGRNFKDEDDIKSSFTK